MVNMEMIEHTNWLEIDDIQLRLLLYKDYYPNSKDHSYYNAMEEIINNTEPHQFLIHHHGKDLEYAKKDYEKRINLINKQLRVEILKSKKD